MSDTDITTKIEEILSSILSEKHNAKIKIKFVNRGKTTNDER